MVHRARMGLWVRFRACIGNYRVLKAFRVFYLRTALEWYVRTYDLP